MPRPFGRQRALGPYLDSERGSWEVVTREADGTRRRRRFAEEDEAQAYVDDYNDAASAGSLTVAQALEKYERHYLVALGNKPNSWVETKRRILRLVGDDDQELDAITSRRAVAMYARLVDSGMAADSHRGCLTHTKTFFIWCVAAPQKWLAENPFADVVGQGKKKKGKDQLRRDEARLWLRCAYEMAMGGEWRALMAMMTLMFGERASEILTRRVRDVDDDAGVLWVEGKTAAGRRTLQVPEVLRPLLRHHTEGLRAAHAIGAWLSGQHLGGAGEWPLFGEHNRRFVNAWVQKLCVLAGVRRVTAHGMRGLHSSLAVEEGTTSHAVARAMGHETFAVTSQHYVSSQAKAAAGQRRVTETFGVIKGGKR